MTLESVPRMITRRSLGAVWTGSLLESSKCRQSGSAKDWRNLDRP